MVDDAREERQKQKEDPPRVRQCVTTTPVFSFSLSFFSRSRSRRDQRMSHCLFPFLSLSLSLLVHQMAPSIRAAKVLGNLAKINERAILGAEVTPGLCQARNI